MNDRRNERNDARRVLQTIRVDVAERCASTMVSHATWPCGAGCDACCRSLAALPEMTSIEWTELRAVLGELPADSKRAVAAAMEHRRALGTTRPIVCPLLDEASGLCRVYDARPIACRTYGFYAERDGVLGCDDIRAISENAPEIVWGNHHAVLQAASSLGETRNLLAWFETDRVWPLDEPKDL